MVNLFPIVIHTKLQFIIICFMFERVIYYLWNISAQYKLCTALFRYALVYDCEPEINILYSDICFKFATKRCSKSLGEKSCAMEVIWLNIYWDKCSRARKHRHKLIVFFACSSSAVLFASSYCFISSFLFAFGCVRCRLAVCRPQWSTTISAQAHAFAGFGFVSFKSHTNTTEALRYTLTKHRFMGMLLLKLFIPARGVNLTPALDHMKKNLRGSSTVLSSINAVLFFKTGSFISLKISCFNATEPYG